MQFEHLKKKNLLVYVAIYVNGRTLQSSKHGIMQHCTVGVEQAYFHNLHLR